MQPEKWQKIERLFSAAAFINDAAEQMNFVAAQAGDDADLRAAVLRLLDNDRREICVVDEPVFTFGTKILAESEDEELIRQKNFGHYHLLKVLGRGGMGVVFLAQDTRLNRKIALKILPASLAAFQETLVRFRQEARAASNVVHPAVAHIYDFGEFDNRYFLAMEYVPGQTLRELIQRKSISQTQAIDITLQIAAALEVAHAAGIIHRDIKPENIIVTDGGAVKVLDFGLAKIEPAKNQNSQNTSLETTPGMIMGTTAYMSPEQVRGQAVEPTTDLWSLGVILYEMLRGNRPFAGETSSDIRAAILRDEPDFDNLAPLPKRFLDKALQKEKSARYQTAAETVVDLKKLKPLAAGARLTDLSGARKITEKFRSPNTFRSRYLLGGIMFLTLLSGFIYFLFAPPKVPAIANIERLTNSGKAKYTSISKDGALLAYSIEELGGRAIYLTQKNAATAKFEKSARQLLSPTKNIISQLAFSPDNQFLYYKSREPGKSVGSLFRLAIDGKSAAEKIFDDIQGAPSFSADGMHFVFFRLSRDNSHEEIIIADTTTGAQERVLYRRARPDFIPDTAQPSWSPDGKTIICAVGTYAPEAESYNVYAINVDDGTTKPLLAGFWSEVWATCWIENGAAFVFAGHQEKLADNNQLWHVSFPRGEVTRLTSDYYDYFTVFAAQAKDGEQTEILSLVLQRTAQIYRANLEKATASAIALTAEGDHGYGLSVSGDGRVFYGSTKAGNPDVWSMAADGSNQRQLTFERQLDSQPFVTKDGKYVVFGSYRSGTESLWRMRADGSEQKLLAPNISRDSIAVAPDGEMIFYRNESKESEAIWRVSINGGEPEKFAAGNYKSVAISPDGKLLAATRQTEQENQLAILSIESPAQPLQVFALTEGSEPLEKIRFTPDGKAVAYIAVKSGVGNLWAQPLDGAPAKPLTDFNANRLYSFDFAPDGKEFYCSRGELNSYVVGITLRK